MAQVHAEGVVYLPTIAGVLGLLVVVAGAVAGLELAAVGWMLILLLIGVTGSGAIALLRSRRTPG
ncbi:MAG: hypothetical protein ABEH59_07110 [Halobacteriales archaeon]